MLGVLIGLIWAARVIYKHGQCLVHTKRMRRSPMALVRIAIALTVKLPAKLGEAIDDTNQARSVDDLIFSALECGR